MKPIKVFYSTISGRFYASSSYRVAADGVVTITGKKFDVTDDIGGAVTAHDIVFSAALKQEGKK